jgi:hypothetical protein
VSHQTNDRVQVAGKASSDASMSGDSAAGRREELSASINDISRQPVPAAGMASRAVNQARESSPPRYRPRESRDLRHHRLLLRHYRHVAEFRTR